MVGMDSLTAHTTAFLDQYNIQGQYRNIVMEKVGAAFSESEKKLFNLYSVVNAGPLRDKLDGVCFAFLNTLQPQGLVELATLSGPLKVHAYFKALLGNKRTDDLTKEELNFYLVMRFGQENLEKGEEPTKEMISSIFEKFFRYYRFVPEAYLDAAKKVIGNLDPSNPQDVSWFIRFVGMANVKELKPLVCESDCDKFLSKKIALTKRYSPLEGFMKWLISYLPSFLQNVFKLAPDVKDLIEELDKRWKYSIQFPVNVPRAYLYELEPIKNRIRYMDLSLLGELSDVEKSFLATFDGGKGVVDVSARGVRQEGVPLSSSPPRSTDA